MVIPNQIGAQLLSLAQRMGETASRFLTRTSFDHFSSCEAQVLGQLVRTGELPAEEVERLRSVLAGRMEIDAKSVLDAHRRIRPVWTNALLSALRVAPIGTSHPVVLTPLESFPALEEVLGRPVYLKREDCQPVGSFKNRGATNFLVHALLAGYDPATLTIGTASHGNHAHGVVRAAQNLGIRRVEVLLPRNASPLKIAQLKSLGAEVELFGDTFEECADEIARRASKYANYLFLPAFDHPLVVAGQGTVGVEISLQMAAFGADDFAVVAPAGGGGLIAGMATYLKRDGAPGGITAIGVESKAHPYISRSHGQKRIVEPDEIKHIDTVADGIALLKIGAAGFRNILRYVRGVEVVPERLIQAALVFLEENGLTLEGAAATPVAGLLFGGLSLERYGVAAGAPVVIVATGRNIDPALMSRLVSEHGEGRWKQLWSHLNRLKAELAAAGYWVGGSVRPLSGAEEGIVFVDFLVSKLPEGWDVLDALSLLDFGPWTPVKGVNATLRSLGQFHERWNHSKEEALTHPESLRGMILENALRGLEQGTLTPAQARDMVPLVKVERLYVETYVLDVFLRHPEWLELLRPEMPPDRREVYFAHFQGKNDGLKASIQKFRKLLERLENS